MTTPAHLPTDSKTLSVRIWRGAAEGNFKTYQVPRNESQTILDIVTYVQRELDPTLSYRFACRVGMCGSCAMLVNGQARWTCRTHVSRVLDQSTTLEIAPQHNAVRAYTNLVQYNTQRPLDWDCAKCQH